MSDLSFAADNFGQGQLPDAANHIYVMTHKAFTPPPDPFYVPLQVGRKTAEKALPYCGDDTGENISEQNCYYSELTGMYWVWKNVKSDVVGICHYRRYLLDTNGAPFTEAAVLSALEHYDVITTKNLQLNFPYEEGFASHHKPVYMETTAAVIRELYPEYADVFARLVREKHTYFGNMMILKKELYDAYMDWLFTILFAVQKRVKVEEEDSYHRRIFGFISEFLQYVWITKNELSVMECMVGMLGEKAEVTEAKRHLAEYFSKGDVAGAKQYFLSARQRRPDLLMEASDVTGELHLCMEVIAIAGLEQETYGFNLLQRQREFGELMRYCNRLNRYAIQQKAGEADPELARWVQEQGVTKVALRVADAVTTSMEKKD
jgi:hypothetical protein